jgi:DNA-binding MarR family transcriptional regulator
MTDDPGPERSFGRSISRLNVYKNIYLSKALEPHGLGSGQYIFLLYLYRMEGASQDELTGEMLVDKATTARAVKKLEERGYIKRTRDEDDRRILRLQLTRKGVEFKPVLGNILDEWTRGLTVGLSEKEKEDLLNLLEKIEKNAGGMI